MNRLEGKAKATESPIGLLPARGEINISGLEIDYQTMDELFDIDGKSWLYEVRMAEQFFAGFGENLPPQLRAELIELESRLIQSQHAWASLPE